MVLSGPGVCYMSASNISVCVYECSLCEEGNWGGGGGGMS